MYVMVECNRSIEQNKGRYVRLNIHYFEIIIRQLSCFLEQHTYVLLWQLLCNQANGRYVQLQLHKEHNDQLAFPIHYS